MEVAEKVRREYGQRGHSTDELFKYGRLRCSGRFTVSLFKVRQFLQWQLVRSHSDTTLQEHYDKEDVTNTRQEETTIHAIASAMAFLNCDAAMPEI